MASDSFQTKTARIKQNKEPKMGINRFSKIFKRQICLKTEAKKHYQ